MSVRLADEAAGKWGSILAELGVPSKALTGKHGPCPFCDGKDRFRFDDCDGKGTFFCSHCGSGDGPIFAMRWLGCDFRAMAIRVQPILGTAKSDRKPPSSFDTRRLLRALWLASKPVQEGDLASRYLASRGCWPLPFVPQNLRFAPCVHHTGSGRSWPCLVSVVSDPAGKPVTLHRTWIAEDGSGKAPVEPPRALMPGKMPPGVSIQPEKKSAVLGVSEGLETALSCSILFGEPVWSTISAGGLQSWSPPEGVERVVVYGDHDANFVGQAAAYGLAKRLADKYAVEVRLPDRPGMDWNDVLARPGHGR